MEQESQKCKTCEQKKKRKNERKKISVNKPIAPALHPPYIHKLLSPSVHEKEFINFGGFPISFTLFG